MSITIYAINRAASWPLAYTETPTVPMFILKSAMAITPITNLKTSATGDQASFNTALLPPHVYDTRHTVADVVTATTLSDLQKLLGGDPFKTSRVNTKVVATLVLHSEHQIVTACANTTILTHILVEHDIADKNESDVPFLHSTSRKLDMVLTSRECLEYSARYHCNVKLHYYAFGLLNRIHCICFKMLRDEASVLASTSRFGNSKTASVSLSVFKLATSCRDKGLEALAEAFSDAKEIEHKAMYTSSIFSKESNDAYMEELRKRKRDKVNDGKSKHQLKREKYSNNKNTRNSGALVCKSKTPATLSPTAKWPKGEKPLCPATLHGGSRGCLRTGCKKSHNKINV